MYAFNNHLSIFNRKLSIFLKNILSFKDAQYFMRVCFIVSTPTNKLCNNYYYAFSKFYFFSETHHVFFFCGLVCVCHVTMSDVYTH